MYVRDQPTSTAGGKLRNLRPRRAPTADDELLRTVWDLLASLGLANKHAVRLVWRCRIGEREDADAGQKLLFLGLDNAGKTTVGLLERMELFWRLADAHEAVTYAQGTSITRGLDLPLHGVESWAKLATAHRTTECTSMSRLPAPLNGTTDSVPSAVLQPTLHPSTLALASCMSITCTQPLTHHSIGGAQHRKLPVHDV